MTKTDKVYHGRYRKEMNAGVGKNRSHAFEGIFSRMNWNHNKAVRQYPLFSFFKPSEEDYTIGICKLCMTDVKVLYAKGKPYLVNIEDGQFHKKWIYKIKGYLCSPPKSEHKGESETMKRLKNKKMKVKDEDFASVFSIEE